MGYLDEAFCVYGLAFPSTLIFQIKLNELQFVKMVLFNIKF